MPPAIKVENLSKSYLVGHNLSQGEKYTAIRDVVSHNFKNLARKTRDMLTGRQIVQGDEVEEFWALKDVSFEIQPGDRVGIIGRNGAGKSTLLKILSRITEPTTGRVTINGRVASLLEVGTGFHPELTGRENIFLNGAILGMSRREIQRKFDEIVAFSEVEKFLDTPVKRYSSGMYVRLAFAVAAHLEPEILVVDEVLAVGDVQFQKKCLGKMEEVGEAGRTVLFVSHNMAAVQNLCRKGVVLSGGRIQYIGTQLDAVSNYLEGLVTSSDSLLSRTDRTGTGEVQVEYILFVDSDGQEIQSAVCGQDISIRFYFRKKGGGVYPRAIIGIAVKTQMESPVFLQHSRLSRVDFGDLPTEGYFEIHIPSLPLPASNYSLGYSILQDGSYLDLISNAAQFTVSDGDFFGSGEVPPISHGVCLVNARWSMTPT